MEWVSSSSFVFGEGEKFCFGFLASGEGIDSSNDVEDLFRLLLKTWIKESAIYRYEIAKFADGRFVRP